MSKQTISGRVFQEEAFSAKALGVAEQQQRGSCDMETGVGADEVGGVPRRPIMQGRTHHCIDVRF